MLAASNRLKELVHKFVRASRKGCVQIRVAVVQWSLIVWEMLTMLTKAPLDSPTNSLFQPAASSRFCYTFALPLWCGEAFNEDSIRFELKPSNKDLYATQCVLHMQGTIRNCCMSIHLNISNLNEFRFRQISSDSETSDWEKDRKHWIRKGEFRSSKLGKASKLNVLHCIRVGTACPNRARALSASVMISRNESKWPVAAVQWVVQWAV